MNKSAVFAIGSYTEILPHVPRGCGEGIVIAELNEERGILLKKYTINGISNPSYLDWDRKNNILYAAAENSEDSGKVLSFSIDTNGRFTLKSLRPGPGRAACHISGNDRGDKIYAVSYGDGSIKGYPVGNGEIGDPYFSCSYEGSGPDRERQSSSHAHQVLVSPDNRQLYVCDLGSDRIWKHQLKSKELNCETALELPPGYGPRHLAFDPFSTSLFIICELKPRIIVAAINNKDGSLTVLQDLAAVDDSLAEITAPAAIKIHPSGETLVVSNRFSNRISVFRIVRNSRGENVSLEFHSDFSSKGKTPRDITFSPSGKWLLIANQDSGDVQLRSFNRDSGYPEDRWGGELDTETPVCLTCLD